MTEPNVGIGDLSGGGDLYGFDVGARPITGNRIGVEVGKTYTAQATFWAETVLRDVRVSIRWYNENREMISTLVGDPITEVSNSWVTAVVSDVAPALSRALDVVVEVIGCNEGEKHYVDTVQVEQKAYATSWNLGKQKREHEELEATGVLTSRSYEFDFIYQRNENWSDNRFLFLHGVYDAADTLSAFVTSDGVITFRCVDALGNVAQAAWNPEIHGATPGLRYMIAFTINEVDRTVRFFIDGNSKGVRSLSAVPLMGIIQPFWLGGPNGKHLNTVWHAVKISTATRTASELKSSSLTHDHDTIFKMDFNRILDSTKQVSLPGKEDLLYRLNNLNKRLTVLEH